MARPDDGDFSSDGDDGSDVNGGVDVGSDDGDGTGALYLDLLAGLEDDRGQLVLLLDIKSNISFLHPVSSTEL